MAAPSLILKSDSYIMEKSDSFIKEKIGGIVRTHFRILAEKEIENCNTVWVTDSWVCPPMTGKHCGCPNKNNRTQEAFLSGEAKNIVEYNKDTAKKSTSKNYCVILCKPLADGILNCE